MKNVVLIIISCFTTALFAQNTSISGSYYQSSGNPEGGTTFIIVPNNTFVVAYFGGMRKGTWKQNENDGYTFVFHVEPKFVLYGRNNPKLKDSVSVRMSIDANKGFAVRFNKLKKGEFKPVFNEGANCFSYPYIYKQKDDLTNLEAYAPDFRKYFEGEIYELPEVYDFKIKESYNEFILAGLSAEYSRAESFMATYNNGVLTIEGNKDLKKRKNFEDLDNETLAFIKQHTENEMLPKVLDYGNTFFPNYENPTETDLKSFFRIEPKLTSSKGITVSKSSLFVTNCED